LQAGQSNRVDIDGFAREKACEMHMLRGLSILAVVSALAGNVFAGPVYFLVSERVGHSDHGDSFVLPLTAVDDIAHARDLVRRGAEAAGSAMVFADIVAGADNINRDILAPGKPAWSWHVSHFTSFGDIGIELLDGSPGFIERDVQGWINNTGGARIGGPTVTVGHIGFWNYTVTAELTGPANDLRIAPPVAVPLPAALPAVALLLAVGGTLKLIGRRIRGNYPQQGSNL
jgi:hypothetical protein